MVILADFYGVSTDYLLGRAEHDYSSAAKRNDIIEQIQKELDELKKL